MELILGFFVTYSPLVYLILGLGFLLTGRRLIKSAQEGHEAVYGYEREVAQRKTNYLIATLVIILLLAFTEILLTSFLSPSLPGSSLLATATLNLLSVPTSTFPPELANSLGLITPQVSPTGEASGCIPGQIMLNKPKAGELIKGSVTLQGMIDIPNFGFYKYEYSVRSSGIWSTVQAGRVVGEDGRLGEWDTSLLIPGDYLLRLVVFDNQGKIYPPCVIPVQVVSP